LGRRLEGGEALYDPLELSEITAKIVTRGEGAQQERKYYRLRGGRWYGGIATADCVGCNLRCRFCWSWRVRDRAAHVGYWMKPDEVAAGLLNIAMKSGYKYVRISGGEPTISFDHLVEVMKLVAEKNPGLVFILETNGILIGAKREYAERLSEFENVHVRVSLKGCNEREFSILTGAKPEGFRLQLKALENLSEFRVSSHPAVMMSFSDERECHDLRKRLKAINESYYDDFEEEYVFLYPHVKELLERFKLKPKIAYEPGRIPAELI